MSESEKKLETQVTTSTDVDGQKTASLEVAGNEGATKENDVPEQTENVGRVLNADDAELVVSDKTEKDAGESVSAPSGEGGVASSTEESAVSERANAEKDAKTGESANAPQNPASETFKRLLTNKAVLVGVGVVVVVLVVVALFSTHVICFHEWASATCTEPETCEICGRTQGEPLGHDWSEATCTDSEICSRCGEIQGKALGHSVSNWVVDTDATCSSTGARHGVCSRCGETIKETIPKAAHTPGEWVTKEKAKISPSGNITPGKKAQVCSVCGQEIKTESFTPEISTSKKNALRTAGSYLNTMPFSESGLIKQLEYEGYSHDDAVWAVTYCGANWNEQAAKSAKGYLKMMGFSHSGLVEQLEYEGYTHEQAEYGVSQAGL